MMDIDLEIGFVQNLWKYYKNVTAIAEESKRSEEPEVCIIHFVKNGGTADFISNIISPLKIPQPAINIIDDAVFLLKSHVNANSDSKLILSSFDHFYKVVTMLTENICYSDGPARTARWRESH